MLWQSLSPFIEISYKTLSLAIAKDQAITHNNSMHFKGKQKPTQLGT